MNPAEQSSNGTLWTVEDVAAYLKTSRSWVYEKSKGKDAIPTMRVGGLLRYAPEDVRAWARGERKSTNVVTLKRAT
jgi:predicted DNA-binding transcriptional regulator AlpA